MGASPPPFNDSALQAEVLALRAVVHALLKGNVPDAQAGYLREKANAFLDTAAPVGIDPDSDRAKQIRASAQDLAARTLKEGLPHGE